MTIARQSYPGGPARAGLPRGPVAELAPLDEHVLAPLDHVPVDPGQALEVADDRLRLPGPLAEPRGVERQRQGRAVAHGADEGVGVVALEEAFAVAGRGREDRGLRAVATPALTMTVGAVRGVEAPAVGARRVRHGGRVTRSKP